MSGYTVKFKAVFGQQHSRPPKAQRAQAVPGTAAVPDAPLVTKTARTLALAHRIDQLIVSGQLRDEAHAAAVLGQSRSHISHVMHLLLLSPEIQKDILLGRRVISARRLRAISRMPLWKVQMTAFTKIEAS